MHCLGNGRVALAARQIRAEHPDVGVVVLSQYVEPDYALHLFEEGSAGLAYLLKERVGDIGQLETAIAAVRRGDSSVDAKVVPLRSKLLTMDPVFRLRTGPRYSTHLPPLARNTVPAWAWQLPRR